MCGIAGWIEYGKNGTANKEVIVRRMSSLLSHRGPDEEGMWTGENAVLGHRRLIVLDPAGGKQPMVRKEGKNTYVIVYNGELYNAPDLREELEKRGYIFTTSNSDTEVVLLSYIEWREECLSRFNGIYAFAVWDEDENGGKCFIARDRLGVKPLFYWQGGKSLVFASEIKALLVHPYIKAEVDEEGLAELLSIGPGRMTGSAVFKGIRELLPASYAVFSQNGLQIKKYWQLPADLHQDNPEETAYKIRSILKDAVKRQLNADVPVCTLLSGGLDSSIITALTADNAEGSDSSDILASFSVGYEGNDSYFVANQFEKDLDDFWALKVAEFLNIKNYRVMLDNSQLCETLEDAMAANDLPGMADIDTSLYLFCCYIKKYATVALSGECADEVFGGYPWFSLNQNNYKNNITFPWVRMLEERDVFACTYKGKAAD